MSYTREEQETIIRTDDSTDKLEIYTRQKKMRTKLLRLNSVTTIKETFDEETGLWEDGFYEIPYDRLSLLNLKTGNRKGNPNMRKIGSSNSNNSSDSK